jgi:hypothetical protein
MGHDPAEKTIPKSMAAPKTSQPSDKNENLRWQGPSQGQDEVHVHDDAAKLVFIWKGGRSFRVAWQEFLGLRGQMEAGDLLAFIGETKNPGNGRKAGILLWEKLEDGSMEYSVVEHDNEEVYEHEIRASPNVEWVDEWVERKC